MLWQGAQVSGGCAGNEGGGSAGRREEEEEGGRPTLLGSSYLMSLTWLLSLRTFSHMLYSVACTLAELCVAKMSSVVPSTLW